MIDDSTAAKLYIITFQQITVVGNHGLALNLVLPCVSNPLTASLLTFAVLPLVHETPKEQAENASSSLWRHKL